MSKGNFFFIYPDQSINEIALKNFNPLQEKDFIYLNSVLMKNNFELVLPFAEENSMFTVLPNEQESHFNSELPSQEIQTVHLDSGEQLQKLSAASKYNFFINPFGFGLNAERIERLFSFLEHEEDIVAFSMHDEVINLIAFNNYDEQFASAIANSSENSSLKKILALEKLFYRFDCYELIRNFDALKNLYQFLSKKESIPYCSQKMHEEFTHIFIEYKDQIN